MVIGQKYFNPFGKFFFFFFNNKNSFFLSSPLHTKGKMSLGKISENDCFKNYFYLNMYISNCLEAHSQISQGCAGGSRDFKEAKYLPPQTVKYLRMELF